MYSGGKHATSAVAWPSHAISNVRAVRSKPQHEWTSERLAKTLEAVAVVSCKEDRTGASASLDEDIKFCGGNTLRTE